ncbi:MAG TPA: tetratricopeptide repeat protein, partial [Phycisphaerae bacterium]|nr:tetratricopeptide repeat protein [Phycisphaerae bacterium]
MRTRLTPLLLILMLSTAVRADLMDDELAKAKALLIAGKSEDASIRLTGLQAAAQALVEKTPSDDHALYILGSSAMLLGDDAVAGSALARAARLKPQNVVYALALGQLADMQDDADQAIARYKAATAIDATSVEAWTQLGLMQRQAGKPADAQASFEKAADLAPKDPKFPGLIGQALADQRKDDDALAMYNKALALDPKYAPAYSGMGQVNEAKGDLAAALAAYAKAADLTPEDFRSIAKLVQLNDTLGNTKDRDAARDRILALKKAGKVDAPSYCRQIFPAGKATVMVFEYLDPKLG